jgi:hypothetical protein
MQKHVAAIEPGELLSGSHYYVRVSCKTTAKVPGHVLTFRFTHPDKDEWLRDETRPSKPSIYARRRIGPTIGCMYSVVLGPVSSLQSSNVSLESEEGPVGERNGFEVVSVEVTVLELDIDAGDSNKEGRRITPA